MAQLRIPEEYVPGLAQIASLPDQVIHELTSALADCSPSLDVKAGTSSISSKVPGLSINDLRRILVALLSLYSLRAFSEIGADDFIDDITRAMKRSRRPELALDDSEMDSRFRDRLRRLLGLSALDASRAVFLQHEQKPNGRLVEAKQQRFTAEGKRERVTRSLAALNQPPSIRLMPNEWRQIVEDPDLEDQFS